MNILKNNTGGTKIILTLLAFLIIFAGLAVVFVKYYSYIFSKDITGEVLKVERVTAVTGILGSGARLHDKSIFSFAVAIKDLSSKEIFTSSTEDRKWAVVTPGFCVTAKFYPYPPWNLDKSGTFHNARLLRMRECDSDSPKKKEKLKSKKDVVNGLDDIKAVTNKAKQELKASKKVEPVLDASEEE